MSTKSLAETIWNIKVGAVVTPSSKEEFIAWWKAIGRNVEQPYRDTLCSSLDWEDPTL